MINLFIKIIIKSKPKAKARPRFTRYGRAFAPDKEKAEEIKKEIRQQVKQERSHPLKMEVVFFMPIPKSTSKKNRKLMLSGEIKHTKKPDIDNLLKMPMDCMNGIVYVDDSQVYEVKALKKYDENPRTEINIVWDEL